MGYSDLEHIDHRVRLQAIHRASRELGPGEPHRLLELLAPRSIDPHAQVRAAVAIALGDAAVTTPALLTPLAELARTSDDDRDGRRKRLTALAALARAGRQLPPEALQGDPWAQACDAALSACASSKADTRFQALGALARLQASGPPVLDVARKGLEDDDPEVVAAAAELLAMLDDTDSLPALDKARARLRDEPHRQVLLAMATLLTRPDAHGEHADVRDRIIRSLLPEARTLPYGLRACEILGLLGDKDHKAAIIEALTPILRGWFTHRLIKVAAAAAMTRLGNDEGLSALRKSMTHRKPDARGYAIEWIGRLAPPDAIPELRALLNDPRDYHSDTAAYALGLMNAPEADAVLTDALNDPRSEVRLEAARALFRHGRANAQLASLSTDDPDAEVRDAAAGLDELASYLDPHGL